MFKLFQNVLRLLGKPSITPVTLFTPTVVLLEDHTVHIEEAKILTVEPKWFERGVKEVIYIRALHPSLNRDGGRYNLPPLYNNMITRHVNTKASDP